MTYDADVLIIGAGPSGSVAAKLLKQMGHSSIVLERSQFPRFSIGESLLPQCMEILDQAGMLKAVNDFGFQYKDGAAFHRQGQTAVFDFKQKFSQGPETTFQVQRAQFDKLLADQAEQAGVEIHYQNEIIAVDAEAAIPNVTARNNAGETRVFHGKFILDASGFGRVLPRLLDLETPSSFPVRQSLFTHIEDNIDPFAFDRSKIRVTIHPQYNDVWFWLIPFSNGRCSAGIVAEESYFSQFDGDNLAVMQSIIEQMPDLAKLLEQAKFDQQVNKISGYAANVKSLFGKNFALLGNAGEFLDPVFSSGVTIALKSASLAAQLLNRQLLGESVDWQSEYADELQVGVRAFKTYVQGWYDGRFQTVLFHPQPQAQVKSMLCSILAGYAWDQANPYVKNSERRLNVLAELCAQ